MRTRRMWRGALWLSALALAAAAGCGRGEREPARSPAAMGHAEVGSPGSPNAKPGFEALQAPHGALHPGDGAGRAWLVLPAARTRLVAGSDQHFAIVYEAAEPGIRAGGSVTLYVPPNWGWSRPQVEDEAAEGFCRARSLAEGVETKAQVLPGRRFQVHVGGRALRAGEQLRLEYGAGAAGARIDRFAEQGSPFWIEVDADGDGVGAWIAEPPRVDVVARPPAFMELVLPTTARPGDTVPLTVAFLDPLGSAGHPLRAVVDLVDTPAGLDAPASIELEPRDRGHRRVDVRVREPGVYRLRGRSVLGGVRFSRESNPLVVREDAPSLLWADLHGHSQESDGTGPPSDYLAYARDVAGLDVVALTDHDRWGTRFLDERPDAWDAVRSAVAEAYEPGRFVTLLGFEWTSWRYGHRHVLYFDGDGPLLSVGDPALRTPDRLWRALAGRRALTFAHHSAGEPVAVDWSFLPPPELEPVTEVASVHGSSEARDTPLPIRGGLDGYFVRDVLDRGVRFGFIGSGDTHNGHPGFSRVACKLGGGLAALFADGRTRDAVYASLRARHVYATNGWRIWLQATLDGHAMGETLPPPAAATQELAIEVVAEGPLARVERIRGGEVVESQDAGGKREWRWRGPVPSLASGDYLYVRAVQEDGGAAWSSPFYAE